MYAHVQEYTYTYNIQDREYILSYMQAKKEGGTGEEGVGIKGAGYTS